MEEVFDEIKTMETTCEKGKRFEEICIKYIESLPHVVWAKLYASSKLDSIKRKLNLPLRDKGIDGIYLSRCGHYGLFQSKYRSNGKTTFDDIRGGLGMHDRVIQTHSLAPYIFLTNGFVPRTNKNDGCMSLARHDVLCVEYDDFIGPFGRRITDISDGQPSDLRRISSEVRKDANIVIDYLDKDDFEPLKFKSAVFEKAIVEAVSYYAKPKLINIVTKKRNVDILYRIYLDVARMYQMYVTRHYETSDDINLTTLVVTTKPLKNVHLTVAYRPLVYEIDNRCISHDDDIESLMERFNNIYVGELKPIAGWSDAVLYMLAIKGSQDVDTVKTNDILSYAKQLNQYLTEKGLAKKSSDPKAKITHLLEEDLSDHIKIKKDVITFDGKRIIAMYKKPKGFPKP